LIFESLLIGDSRLLIAWSAGILAIESLNKAPINNQKSTTIQESQIKNQQSTRACEGLAGSGT
jgi:hypothetical protein